MSHILELLEFFVYSRKEDSKYRGTVGQVALLAFLLYYLCTVG
jgi:hypothetical protein